MAIHVYQPGDAHADFGEEKRLYPIPEMEEQYPVIMFDKRIQSTFYIQAEIIGAFNDWILSFFEPDYFKMVRIKTQTPFSEFKSFMKQIYKKDKPLMVIDPAAVDVDENFLFSQNMLNRYNNLDPMTDNVGAKMIYSLDLMADDKFSIVYRRNRFRFDMNVMIMEQTLARQMNTYNAMVMNIRHNSKFMIRREIPHLIPLVYIKNIARMKGMDWNTDEFLHYLNTIAQYTIIKRTTPAGQTSFYFTQEMNIQIETPSMPQRDTPEMSSAIEWGARIVDSFTLIADLPTEYLFLLPQEHMTEYDTGMAEDPEDITFVSPVYADMEWPKEIGDYKLTNRADITLTEGDEPTVNLLPLLREYDPNTHRQVMEFIDKKKAPLRDIMQIRVYPNGSMKDIPYQLTEEGVLTLLNPKMNKIYTVNMYLNLGLLNSIDHQSNVQYIGSIEKY